MTHELHVVLGASGTIGQNVIKELKLRNLNIRAVQRNKIIEGIDTVNADLLDLVQTREAIKGATHVYLCIAVPYTTKQWQLEWPFVMENVIKACELTNATLIFLDNVYMYGPSPLGKPFNESHPQYPTSEKGKVRKKVADMLIEAEHSGRIKAVIGRSADFYGTSTNCALYISFLENMIKGKAPQSLGGLDIVHTYAHTTDVGRALVALALDESTYGQVWHLPVSRPITINEVNEIFNQVLGTHYKITVIPRGMLNILGVFITSIKEMKEMLYQLDEPYIMNCEKFMLHFPDFETTKIETGIREMAQFFRLK